jgi:hypothetical protein
MHIKLWLESLKGRAHSKDLGVDERIILRSKYYIWAIT